MPRRHPDQQVYVDEQPLQAALAVYFRRHAQWRLELDGDDATAVDGSVAVALARLAGHVAALPTSDDRLVALSRIVCLTDGRFIAGEQVAKMLGELAHPLPCADELLARFTAACLADAAPR